MNTTSAETRPFVGPKLRQRVAQGFLSPASLKIGLLAASGLVATAGPLLLLLNFGSGLDWWFPQIVLVSLAWGAVVTIIYTQWVRTKARVVVAEGVEQWSEKLEGVAKTIKVYLHQYEQRLRESLSLVPIEKDQRYFQLLEIESALGKRLGELKTSLRGAGTRSLLRSVDLLEAPLVVPAKYFALDGEVTELPMRSLPGRVDKTIDELGVVTDDSAKKSESAAEKEGGDDASEETQKES